MTSTIRIPANRPNASPVGRFIGAQQGAYPRIVREIQQGRKRTHWMWFIFPQHQGLAKSEMAWRFGIKDRAEADAYLDNGVLRGRLFECTMSVLRLRSLAMFSDTDQRKLRACMTLFREVTPDPGPLDEVLERFFEGEPDPRTLDLLAGKPIAITGAYDPNAPRLPFPVRGGHWDGQVRRTQSVIAARGPYDSEPWKRERVNSFVRSFGLSTVATRQLVDAWMADRGKAMGAAWAAREEIDWQERS